MKTLFIYHPKKAGFEKYEFVQNTNLKFLNARIKPEAFLKNYFKGLYGTTPTIKYYDMSIKINEIKFADMFVAFDNGNELILAERIPIIKIKGV